MDQKPTKRRRVPVRLWLIWNVLRGHGVMWRVHIITPWVKFPDQKALVANNRITVPTEDGNVLYDNRFVP